MNVADNDPLRRKVELHEPCHPPAMDVPCSTLKVAVAFPPPGAGLLTTTWNAPAILRSDCVKVTISSVPVKPETACGTPLNVTAEFPVNPFPSIFRVSGPVPAKADAGIRLVIVSVGLEVVDTVKLAAFDVPPPGAGFVTTIWNVPAVPRSDWVKVTTSCVLEKA